MATKCYHAVQSDRGTEPGGKSVVWALDEVLHDEGRTSDADIDPNVCFGKPCIGGHRIWVALILDLLAGGMTLHEVLEDYPGLEKADILACLAYGAEITRERVVHVPLEAST